MNVIGSMKWEAAAVAGQDMTSQFTSYDQLTCFLGLDRLESVQEQKTHLYSDHDLVKSPFE